MKFKEHTSLDLSSINQEVLRRWAQQDLFHRSMEEREGFPPFVFYEGPPSANGHPGIHHVMARTLKDVVCRYQTMTGHLVRRKAGWDTHGLPVELGVEKELGITKEDIGHKVSVEEYNARCRENVMRFTAEWTDLSEQMGYWVDMEHPYVTYENAYMETLWWLLAQLYKKGLLYKGYTIQPYSPAAGTGLSSHELNQPGCYRDVKDMTATALFKCNMQEAVADGLVQDSLRPLYLAAWTTTPWTLPSNTALCVGPNIDYVLVETEHPYTQEAISVIVAEARAAAYFKMEGEEATARIVQRMKGADLVGLHYEPLMPWIKPCGEADGSDDNATQFTAGGKRFAVLDGKAFRVIPGDYVTTDDGTGIVHIAPTFGADDARVAKAAGIPSLFVITRTGEMRPMVDFTGKYYTLPDMAPEFVQACVDVEKYAAHEGAYVKNAYDPRFNENGKYDAAAAEKAEDLNLLLALEMKQAGTALRLEKHVHNYPHCWRTDKPVLYYPLDSWFIRSSAMKERMSQLNTSIRWKPSSTGTGRFAGWLENLNDWNLSRSRYWGTPLPIWRNKETQEEICIDSIATLYDEIEKSVAAGIISVNPLKEKGFVPGCYTKENYDRIDLHRPYVDEIILCSPSGKPMHRETDLIDVWFDSGAMPYAQLHYPFENRELIDEGKAFPAHFIAEGVDQTRGWFFTLHAIGTMVFDSVAFRSVISNGLVLDKNGMKMSKRLGNAVDPFEAIKKYGSDPLRWYMITNSQPWDNLKFDEEGVAEVARSFFSKLYQTYAFFALYANIDDFQPQAEARTPSASLDQWILSELQTLIKEVRAAYDDLEPTRAGRLIQTFVIDNLSNWHVRLSRKRFWQGDKEAMQTLYTCLETVARLMAPIAPFFADQLYHDLTEGLQGAPESVHLCFMPESNETLLNETLQRRMRLAQKTTTLALSIRKKERIIVRQPLGTLAVPLTSPTLQEDLEAVAPLVLDEINVKELAFIPSDRIEKQVKCNFRVMGKKFGKQMKAVAAAVGALSAEEITTLETDGKLTLTLEDDHVVIERDDVEIHSTSMPGWSVASEGPLTVALDLTITPELQAEGYSRELVKRIQTYRKESGFGITDRIQISILQADALQEQGIHVFSEKNLAYLQQQVLAQDVHFLPALPTEQEEQTLPLDDFTLHFSIVRTSYEL